MDDYINALGAGRCDKAYSLVSQSAKDGLSGYKNYENFVITVCAPVAKKYAYLKLYKVEGVQTDTSDTVSILCRIRYKSNWMPNRDFRTLNFNMVREGGKWRVDGPELQP